MNLLLLPGNSKRNKEWLQQVEAHLAPYFNQTYRHDYAHWNNDESEIDFEKEVEQLALAIKNLSPYMIFAKSAGSVLICKAIAMGVLRPQTCLFAGFPLAMVQSYNLPVGTWLQGADFPITVVQHSSDPFGFYQDTNEYFIDMKRNNITVHSLPGNTHDYLEFQIFKEFLEKLAR